MNVNRIGVMRRPNEKVMHALRLAISVKRELVLMEKAQ